MVTPLTYSLRTIEPTGFGSGWASGVVSAALGLIGLGAVLCFRFPELLTTPEATAVALTSRGVLMLTDGLLALAAGALPRRR